MNCPVCNRNLAPTLSICPSCGAMMNDSVREELKDKITVAQKSVKIEARPNPPVMAPKMSPLVPAVKHELPPIESAPIPKPLIVNPAPPVAVSAQTKEFNAKPTSPTLVEFQNKNAALPDWRLQLQNAVRKRVENVVEPAAPVEAKPAVSRVHLPTNGGAALKAEVIEETAPAAVAGGNPKLASALKRIEESRKRFLPEEPKDVELPKVPPPAAQNKKHPFYIATKNAEVMPKPAEVPPAPPALQKPTIDDLPVIEKKDYETKKDYDTNRLKPLPNAAVISTNLEKLPAEALEIEEAPKDAPLIKISRVVLDDEDEEILEETGAVEEEETEDLAPFALRFNAAVFDLIIGAFTSVILLAPFMLSKNWYSFTGLLAFLVTCAIVMFVYLTTAVGMFGKTVGMKIFSLEAIDIEENDYPTFHQAAVSSSVYLVSLALGGVGFLPALFNSERRTAPDLLSGTVIVKEY